MHVANREVRAKLIEHQPIHRKNRVMRRGDVHRRRIGRIEHESGSFMRRCEGDRDARAERFAHQNDTIALALTVDTITGGNRERDLRTGFTSPPRLTLKSLLSFAMHPRWAANYFMHEKFELPQLKDYVKEGSSISVSVGDYFSTMLDQSMNWQDAADVRKKWGKQFCLKGIMSIADAKRAVDIGATAIMVSNHGGRQLDGSRSPFDQLAEIVDAVGDRIDVICDGGITRGTHVLKALSVGAKACSGGRLYLYALAAAGQAGVERALENLRFR
jgi:L-lactate dehydrogenase (cytochrome)